MTKKNCSFLIGIIGCFIFGCWSLYAGQDVNWDLRNYHLYNAYAFVFDRIGFDYAPAGVQTYLNPLIDLPYFYLSRLLSPAQYGFAIGMLQGINFWILYEISRLLIQKKKTTPCCLMSIFIAITGVYTPTVIGEIGTTYGDLIVALFVLSSLYFGVRFFQSIRSQEGKCKLFIAISGLMLGLAVGLKLTAIVFSIATFLALLFSLPASGRVIRTSFSYLIIWGGGCILGLLITGGYWSFKLYSIFGSPVFPFYNSLFKSPYFPKIDFFDENSGVKNILEFIFHPFLLNSIFGHPYQEIRFAVVETLGVMLMIVATTRKLRGERFDLNKSISSSKRESAFFLLSFFLFSYLIWLWKFGVYRYQSPLDLLSPLVIFLLISLLLVKRVLLVFVITSLVIITMVRLPYFSDRVPWQESFSYAELPVKVEENCTLLVLHSGEPLSFVIPSFPKSCRFLRVGNGEWKWTRMLHGSGSAFERDIQSIIRSSQGPFYLLTTEDIIHRKWAKIEPETSSLDVTEPYAVTIEKYCLKIKGDALAIKTYIPHVYPVLVSLSRDPTCLKF